MRLTVIIVCVLFCLIGGSANADVIVARVDCGARIGGGGYDTYQSNTYARCTSSSAPPPGERPLGTPAEFLSQQLNEAFAAISLPGATGDFLVGATAAKMSPDRIFGPSESLLEALALLDGKFELNITLPQGGAGVFVPCLVASFHTNIPWPHMYPNASFAGFSVGGMLLWLDPDFMEESCPAEVSSGIPFQSGVTQVVQGRFEAMTSPLWPFGEYTIARLNSILVFPEGTTVADPRATITLRMAGDVVVPEPGTFALSGLALLSVAAAMRARRSPRKGAS